MLEFPSVGGEEWRARVEKELGPGGLDSLSVETLEGIRLVPLYPPCAPDGAGFPGAWPFARGSLPVRARPPWTVCQAVAEPDLTLAAEQIAADRRGGVGGVWLQLDAGARLGAGPEAPAVGDGAGLTACDAADLAELLEAAGDGPLSVRLGAGGNALPVAALLAAALERAERDPGDVRVHLGMDPLGALLTDGALPAAPEALAREAAILTRLRDGSFPCSRSLTASTVPYTRAGADSVQALALATATAVEYLRWLDGRDVDVARAAGQIDFVFEGDRDLLLDVCKLRAARALWARVQTACGIEARGPWIHAVTGRRTLTRADPWTNILRATVQCVAAILGGADAITTLPFDIPLGRPDDLGRRVARGTQAILAEESGLGRTLDPFGGADAVEALTMELARRAWSMFQEIESSGGLLACVRGGQVHSMIADTVHQRAERAAAGDTPVLGVSAYLPEEDTAPERERPARAPRAAAGRRLDSRRQESGAPALEPLAGAVREEDDGARLWEALLEAARSGATVAELSAALRPGARQSHVAPLAANTDEELTEGAAAAGEER